MSSSAPGPWASRSVYQGSLIPWPTLRVAARQSGATATGPWPYSSTASTASPLGGGGFQRGAAVAAGGDDLGLQLFQQRGVLLEVFAGLLPALAELHIAVAEPGPGADDQLLFHGQVEHVAFVADAVGVHHVELGDAEGRGHLVLDHFRPHPLADDLLALLELPDAADVDAAGAVELQGPAAGRGLGVAEHHADLLADLVDEDHRRLALADRPGQLPHRLAHQPGLQADVRIADLAFQFLLGDQGGHGVDDDHVHGVGADEHLRDVHGLFAAARLADQERFQLDAQLLGPTGVQGVLGVDEGGDAALALRLGDDVQGQRGLAAGLGAEDLDHPAAGNPLPAQGHVQRQAAGGDAGDAADDAGPQGHDRPFAELLFDLGDGGLQRGMGVQHGADAVAASRRLGRRLGLGCFLRHRFLRFRLQGRDHGQIPSTSHFTGSGMDN